MKENWIKKGYNDKLYDIESTKTEWFMKIYSWLPRKVASVKKTWNS